MVVITIWVGEKDSTRQLGQVEVQIGQSLIRSETTPSFGVRVPRVTDPK